MGVPKGRGQGNACLLRGESSAKCYCGLSPASHHRFITLPPSFLGAPASAPLRWVPAPKVRRSLCGLPLHTLQVSGFAASPFSNIPSCGVLPAPWGSHSLCLSFPRVSESLPRAFALILELTDGSGGGSVLCGSPGTVRGRAGAPP